MVDKSDSSASEVVATSVSEVVEGLLLFNEPVLNSRFHALLDRMADDSDVESLRRVPALVTEGQRMARRAAESWSRTAPIPVGEKFVNRGERAIMEAFLSLTESQLATIAFMARNAPTMEIRAPFDTMAEKHREIARILRAGLARMSVQSIDAHALERKGLRSVQEEGPGGDLRTQLENAIRAARDDASGIRAVTLSHTALRHLRDQGCFLDGETTLFGVPVEVDMSWDEPAFALRSFDVVPLDEMTTSKRQD